MWQQQSTVYSSLIYQTFLLGDVPKQEYTVGLDPCVGKTKANFKREIRPLDCRELLQCRSKRDRSVGSTQMFLRSMCIKCFGSLYWGKFPMFMYLSTRYDSVLDKRRSCILYISGIWMTSI